MDVVPLNDLSRISSAEQEAREAAVVGVLRGGWYLRGPQTGALEQELAAFLGVAGAVAVANGTDALELVLRAVGCGPGDEVLTAANAGGYASTAIRQTGARPRYGDIDPQTFGLSSDAVDRGLAAGRLAAVVVTHLYGQMADVEAIVERCRRDSVPVIEDCAQAIGAQRAGRRAGSFGAAAAFSFYPTKNLGALGDAGAVVTEDPALLERVRRLAQYGWEDKYRVTLPGGRNSRIDELQAAVLRIGLRGVDAANARRREVLGRYARALPKAAGRVVGSLGPDHVGHLGVVWLGDRAAAQSHLVDRGVETAVHYPIPDHRQEAWAGQAGAVQLRVTEDAAEHVLSLPLFPGLRDDEVERVCDALAEL